MSALHMPLNALAILHAGASQELHSPTFSHGGPLAPAPPPEALSQPPPRRQSVPEHDEDDEDVEEQAAAAHVLLCCDDSLRLYPAEGIRLGDRWNLQKDKLLRS